MLKKWNNSEEAVIVIEKYHLYISNGDKKFQQFQILLTFSGLFR